jgi:hypothetical protein
MKWRAARRKQTCTTCAPFAWQGDVPPPLPREAEKRGGFDAVLVDAPCTSSGTWRRNPDARFRYADIADGALIALQEPPPDGGMRKP